MTTMTSWDQQADEDQKATETTQHECQDLAVLSDLKHIEYRPEAYLVAGAKYLDHAACRLGPIKTVATGADGAHQHEVRDVRLLYPASQNGKAVETTQVPFGDLVLQRLTHKDGPGFCIPGQSLLSARVGIPKAIYTTLQRIIRSEALGADSMRSLDFSSLPKLNQHDDHVWLHAEADKQLKGFVYIDAKRKEVDMCELMEAVVENVKCDAFATCYIVRGQSGSSRWRLGMTIKELLIIDTTTVQSRALHDGELVVRQKYSSPKVVDAFKKLQLA